MGDISDKNLSYNLGMWGSNNDEVDNRDRALLRWAIRQYGDGRGRRIG
jgi:hypothetical protein